MKQKNVTAISGRVERFTVGTAIIYLVLAAITLVSFLPFWHIIACTFADANEVANSKFLLFPTNFSFDAIKYVFFIQEYYPVDDEFFLDYDCGHCIFPDDDSADGISLVPPESTFP